MAQQKLGDKKFKKGKQAITVSIFNWSKDYAMGASDFDEALKHYQSAKNYIKCLNTLDELIICNQKNLDNWAVARNYQTIVDIYITHFPDTQIAKLKEKAILGFNHFRMAQSLDKGLSMISRVTKHLISRKHLQQGVQILEEAYKISLGQEKSFKKQQLFHQIVEIYIDNELYESATKMYIDQIKHKNGEDCQQLALIVILFEIILGNSKNAQNQIYQLSNLIPSFLSSDESQVADNLIKAYKNGKEEQFKKLTTKAVITTIYPLSIIRKLRAVKVPTAEKYQISNQNDKQKILQNVLF